MNSFATTLPTKKSTVEKIDFRFYFLKHPRVPRSSADALIFYFATALSATTNPNNITDINPFVVKNAAFNLLRSFAFTSECS